jgi:hypothetical protein
MNQTFHHSISDLISQSKIYLLHGRQAPDAQTPSLRAPDDPTAMPSVAERWSGGVEHCCTGAAEPARANGDAPTQRRPPGRLPSCWCLALRSRKLAARPWVAPSRPGRGDGVAGRGLAARGRESPVAVAASRRRLGSREYRVRENAGVREAALLGLGRKPGRGLGLKLLGFWL